MFEIMIIIMLISGRMNFFVLYFHHCGFRKMRLSHLFFMIGVSVLYQEEMEPSTINSLKPRHGGALLGNGGLGIFFQSKSFQLIAACPNTSISIISLTRGSGLLCFEFYN